MEFLFIALAILLVWIVGRQVAPSAIPRSKVRMVIVGFAGGLLGSLVGQDIGKTVLMALAVVGTALAVAVPRAADWLTQMLRGFGL